MKIKPLKQPNSLACGPTCIFLATRYFGDKVSFKKIEQLTGYKEREGVLDSDIVRTCNKLGYHTEYVINTSWNQLITRNKKDSVLIVSWMLRGYIGHVSVVDKVTKDHIFLADSEYGKILKLKKIQFMRLWMEYDHVSWPRISGDIHLRPMIVVKKIRS